MKFLSKILVTAIVAASVLPFCGQSSLGAETGVAINKENFPDDAFRAYVKQYDTTEDDKLSSEELSKVYNLSCVKKGVTDLKGIEYFTALTYLDVSKNEIEELDLSSLSNLNVLDCSKNKISKLDLTHQPRLIQLFCSDNQLEELKLDKTNLSFKTFHVYGNKMTELDISYFPYMKNAYEEGAKSNYLNDENHILYKAKKGILIVDKDVTIKNISTKTSIKEGKGTITESFGSCQGKKVSITATAAKGYEFIKWVIKEGEESREETTPTISFTADQDRECIAYFKVIKVKPTPTQDPNVTPTPEPTQPLYKYIPDDSQVRSRDSVSDFVSRLYKFTFGREAEQEGLEYWTEKLDTYEMTGGEVAQAFICSQEFADKNYSDKKFVDVLYTVFFDREADEEGRNYWLSRLKNENLSRVQSAASFIDSQEWANTCAYYGILSGTSIVSNINIYPDGLVIDLVDGLYHKALERDYDNEGLAYWMCQLASHKTTWEEVGASFVLSDEMIGFNLSDKEYVTRLYRTFMEREPEDDGLKYWVTLLGEGTTRETVVYGFTRSPEFVAKCAEAKIIPFR